MRSLFYILSAAAVMVLAYWAYQENYRTQASLREVSHLQANIANLRETLGILRAEWAYLNRPERLAGLADLNFERLGLVPLEAAQFGEIDQVAYPPLPEAPVTEPIDLQGILPNVGETE
ncbi:cell division protein FtsL [Actibacterium sp. 188UL27-1]|uniref:cell division protein FtsL n=1 Tax=Actibacterium sp. 188UL27-1 TaxID=2786961 RepID=UPI001957FE1D|nr:cell division protein FtsL [Actibacterium sp. 188UL27-1]MBM7068452.1 cell division protein FtsL [Actibacterium sp. 188UL27-1]